MPRGRFRVDRLSDESNVGDGRFRYLKADAELMPPRGVTAGTALTFELLTS